MPARMDSVLLRSIISITPGSPLYPECGPRVAGLADQITEVMVGVLSEDAAVGKTRIGQDNAATHGAGGPDGRLIEGGHLQAERLAGEREC